MLGLSLLFRKPQIRHSASPAGRGRPRFIPRLNELEGRALPSTVFDNTATPDTWTGPFGSAEVSVVVTYSDFSQPIYHWSYHLKNIDFRPCGDPSQEDDGVGVFAVPVADDAVVTNVAGPSGWYFSISPSGLLNGPTVLWGSGETGGWIAPGETADFSFDTPPQFLTTAYGSAYDYQVASQADGPTKGSGGDPVGEIRAINNNGQEVTRGWVPVNNDNDNYNFNGDQATSLDHLLDKDENGQVVGEDDLVAVVIHPVLGAPATDKVKLGIGGNIKVWKSADKGAGQVLSGQTEFPANMATTVYVEGLNLSANVGDASVTLTWASADGTKSKVLDALKMTVYLVTGAMDVPGYSQHTYQAVVPADAGAPAKFVQGAGVQQLTLRQTGLTGGGLAQPATILWDGGPIEGTYVVKPADGFSVTRQVNVVQVAIDFAGPKNKVTTDTTRMYQDTVVREKIHTANFGAGEKTMIATLTVTSVKGPTVRGSMRGVRFIDMGFIQISEHTDIRATFSLDGGPPVVRTANVQGKKYIDSGPADSPWYGKNKTAKPYEYMNFLQDKEYLNLDFEMNDTPETPVAEGVSTNDGLPLRSCVVRSNYTTVFAVHTNEAVNDAYMSYTIRAKATWKIDVSGTFAAGTRAWTGAVPGEVKETKFTEVTNGDIVPPELFSGDDWQFANDALNNMTWS